MEKAKKLGILGGMGPQATQYFFQRIVELTDAKRDQDHMDILIINQATTPDRTVAILSENDKDLLTAMEGNLKILEAWGAENIAIPCNTTHYFFDKIQAKTKIPIINMVLETVKDILSDKKVKKIGILATDGTIFSKIYEKEITKQYAEAIIPSKENQKKVMEIIYDEIKSGKPGDFNKFMEVVKELKDKGCDAIILACTELSYLKKAYKVPEYCVDALEVLAKKSVELSGKRIKEQ